MQVKTIDIFCKIIDNYGDIGVTYRLARELNNSFDNVKVRLFVDRLEEFSKINPSIKLIPKQIVDGIEYLSFDFIEKENDFSTADVIIEAFACNIPKNYMEKAYFNSKLILNLEYISAESWIEDFHLQKSMLEKGSLSKYFFMPGFTEKTGGILISNSLESNFDKNYFKENYSLDFNSELSGTIFSYEKDFTVLVETLEFLNKDINLFVMGEKTQNSFLNIFKKFNIEKLGNIYKYGRIKMIFCPFLKQEEYDAFISLVDFNFVRGEDSFVRAILSSKPFLWHIYPQNENIHMNKLKSFLDRYCSDDESLKNTFNDYNLNNDNYLYFFENLKNLEKHSVKYKQFLLENCNLVDKLKKFIENF